MTIRILNAESLDYSNNARRILLELGKLTQYEQLTRADLLSFISDYDVLIVRLGFQIDREMIDRGTKLKVIVTATTGLDHIDIDYAFEKGITVLSLRGQVDFLRSIVSTAEHTWALLLALTRRIPWAFDAVLQGQWERDCFRGHDLKDKRLGILGLGRIGEKVAQYGLAFGMQVFSYDPEPIPNAPPVNLCTTSNELFKNSDILSIHVPLNTNTIGLIGAKELAELPSGSLVINTSRGQIVDESALVNALESRSIAGVAVDVISQERSMGEIATSPLIHYAQNHKNVIITPHIAGATHQAMAATEIFMAEQLRKFIKVD